LIRCVLRQLIVSWIGALHCYEEEGSVVSANAAHASSMTACNVIGLTCDGYRQGRSRSTGALRPCSVGSLRLRGRHLLELEVELGGVPAEVARWLNLLVVRVLGSA
jgi:hypothetical protein